MTRYRTPAGLMRSLVAAGSLSWMLCVTAAVTAQGTAATHALPPRPQPVVGQPFGDLVLPTLDGSRTVDLDVYRGRKVLLIEFASW